MHRMALGRLGRPVGIWYNQHGGVDADRLIGKGPDCHLPFRPRPTKA